VRRVKAILIGGFFHVEHADEFGLNEEAAAWLYAESIAHQIYMLNAIFHNTLGKKYDWATPPFFVKAVSDAMVDFELEQGTVPGGFASFAFRRCAEIDAMSSAERMSGKQFAQSAAKIAEHDPSADQRAIAARLESVSKQYFDAALPMFR
jgi:hypothetical protein